MCVGASASGACGIKHRVLEKIRLIIAEHHAGGVVEGSGGRDIIAAEMALLSK